MGEWKLFLTEYLREFEEKMDQMDDLSEKLFWFVTFANCGFMYVMNKKYADKNEFGC